MPKLERCMHLYDGATNFMQSLQTVGWLAIKNMWGWSGIRIRPIRLHMQNVSSFWCFSSKEDSPYLAQQQPHFLPPLSSSSEHSWWFHQHLHPAQALHSNPWRHTWLLCASQASSSSASLVSAAVHQDGGRNRRTPLQSLTSFSKQEATRQRKAPVTITGGRIDIDLSAWMSLQDKNYNTKLLLHQFANLFGEKK